MARRLRAEEIAELVTASDSDVDDIDDAGVSEVISEEEDVLEYEE